MTDAPPPDLPGTDRPSWPVLLTVPLVIGCVVGALVGIFSAVVEGWILEDVVLGLPGYWFALPAAGVFLLTRLALMKVAKTNRPGTAELFPTYYHESDRRYPVEQAPGRVLSGATTVGLGGSQGLESQSVLIGDTIAMLFRKALSKRVPFLVTPHGRRFMLVCGAAAGIATVFSSPTLGAVYGIEMPFRDKLDGRRLVPSMIAAASSFMTARLINTSRSLFTYEPHHITAKEIIGLLIVAVLCGVGARAFIRVLRWTRGWSDGSRPWLRALAAGLVLSAVGIAAFEVTGAAVTAGPGYVVSAWAVPGNGPSPVAILIIAALLFRTLSVVISVGGGGGGGVFTSMATNGLLIGASVGVLLGLDNVTLLTMCGATTFLSAGYRLPLAGAGLLAESSGGSLQCALGVLSIGIAMVIMGRRSASGAQRDDSTPDVVVTRPVTD